MIEETHHPLKLKEIIFLVLVIGIIIFGFSFWQKQRLASEPTYAYGYRLVNEKISQSAPIAIYLPPKTDKSVAQKNIKFEPEIKGKWISSQGEKEIVFMPREKLNLNRYYSVQLTLAEPEKKTIGADFLVVEDPKIIAVFPKKGSETPEDTEITIVFNRPMVPLSTLGYLEGKDVPVEINPVTEGRFKWITTNNLQFIPKERLKSSSNYTVKLKTGLTSMDGLTVVGTEIKFTTRHLRYLNLTSGEITYNQPISIYFNQPVDLERTKKEITLMNNITGKEISFITEYQTKNGKESDKSIIQIYNQKDRFGRKKLWDFEGSYSLRINKVYPEEGDIILSEARVTDFHVGGAIKNITAESKRTGYATLDFFDPEGKIWVEFYEDIDLGRSKIVAPQLKEIGYGEKCKEEDKECEKVPDKKKIYLDFKSEKLRTRESLEINFEKVVNTEKLALNKEPITIWITTYPEFEILRTFPGNNSIGASLTDFIICSNTPIFVPEEKDYDQFLKANLDYKINRWDNSWKVSWKGEGCNIGEFQTVINYGLKPLSAYSLEFKLKDVFGQKQDFTLKFTTAKMFSEHLTFYHFQKPYNITSPQKTSLAYAPQNMEYVNLEICKLEPLNFFRYLEKKPRYYEPLLGNCQEIVRDKIELPKKYWVKNFFKVDIKDYFKEPIGHYILTFSHPDYKGKVWDSKKGDYVERNVYERTYLTVTNLAVVEKKILPQYVGYGIRKPLKAEQLKELSNFYWVTDISNLEPIAGVRVNLYQKKELVFVGSYLTNDEGLAFTPIVSELKGAIISKGKDSAILPSSESRLDWVDSAFSAQKIYLYTDKPLYRPGHEVFFKGIYRIGYDGNYEIYQDKEIDFKVFNSRGDEIFNQELEINDFGTFEAKLILDQNAPLGSYRACAKQHSCVYFEVLEYVPAPFEVKIKTDKEEYITGETADLDIEANYYFGVPLEEGGEVVYTISSQNYYFDRYKDGYFSFGSDWYYWPPYEYGERFISRGKTSLDSQGKARISQLLDLEKLFKNKEDRKSKIIIFDVTVKNPQGQSISGQKSFILHAGEFYLGLSSDKTFLGKNEKFNLRVKSVNTQGEGIRIENATLNFYKINWIHSKRLEADGGYSYRWEKQKELIKRVSFNTDNQGNFIQEMQLGEEGSYEVEVLATDRRNNLIWSIFNLYVYGSGEVSIRKTDDTELEIVMEKPVLNVGEQGNFIIKSPYSKAKALISIERGKIFDYQIREIQGNLYNFNFEVKEEYLPNVFVSVLLISQEPEIKFGKAEFKVNTKQKELDIKVKSDKKHYLPGGEVTLDILAKDYQGKPVSGELSIAVVDLSVLALKGNPKKNPIIFFYAGFPLTVSTASNIKDILVEKEAITKGGGGLVAEDLATKMRGIFKETAFWQAVVRTDQKGQARVSFTLPDNLTTWQIESIGLTRDTKLGVDYSEFITRKELMVVPLKPRFIIPGDTFYLGAQIFNQSKERQKLVLKFESQTLLLKDDKPEKEIKIDPGKTETIYFRTQAPPEIGKGEHIFILSAKAQELEDTVRQSISITPNDTYEVTAFSNYTPEKLTKEYAFLPPEVLKDKGELTIKSSATLAVFFSRALNYLLQFPYGCAEQIASKLNSIALIKRGLNLPNIAEKFELEKIKHNNRDYTVEEMVEIGLVELYNNQQYDGGFSFWRKGESNFYVTLHVIETLNNLSLAGFKINQNSLNRGTDYLKREIRNKLDWEDEDSYKDRLIITSYILFGLSDFRDDGFLAEKLTQIASDKLFIDDRISNQSLAYLAITIARGGFNESLKNKVFDDLDNRINIDSRGAFLEPGKNINWRYFETSIKNTALYLKAQVADKRENPVLDRVLRWLLNSRKKDGAWGSTSNTISVIDAFVDFLQWKKETESEFVLELLINEKDKGSFDFNSQTILNQFKKEVPLRDLKFNEINTISFLKTNRNQLSNNLYYDLSLKYYLPIDQIPPRDEGFSVVRKVYSSDDLKNENPLTEAKVGDVLRVNLQITVPTTRNYVMVEDFIPAGMEIVNLDLATEQKSLKLQEKELQSRELIPDFKELRDDRAFLYTEYLAPGVYEFDYYIRALIKGEFTHLPTLISEWYTPENFGRTGGQYFTIK